MKIGFIRYPQNLYSSGLVIRGGSEIANQYVIDYLRSKNIEVVEFEPQNQKRVDLISIPALGTPLMFQDLLSRIDEINSCDVIFTTNWFGAIIPEITKPIIAIFHHNAQLVLKFSDGEIVKNNKIFKKWQNKLRSFSLWQETKQTLHDQIISIGENYLANNSAKNVIVSKFLEDSLVHDYSVDRQKNKIIFNSFPIDWVCDDFEKKYDGELRVTCLTRLPVDFAGAIVKGLDSLFEFFSKETSFNKTLIASTKKDVYKKITDQYSDKFDYIENADRKSVQKELAKANISLHFSRCESFGLSIVESMLMKNVPIVYETGIVKEFIVDGVNGFIVTNEKEMLKIIDKLDKDRNLLKKVSEAAYSSVIKSMSPEVVGQQYLNAIKEVI